MVDYVNLNDSNFPVSCHVYKLRAVEPHYHVNQIVIMYVLKGTVTLHAGSLHRKLIEGEMAFINAGEVHYTEDEKENEILVVHIRINGKLYKNSSCFGKNELLNLKMNLLALTYVYNMDELIDEMLYKLACEKIQELVDETFAVYERVAVEYMNRNYQHTLTAADASKATGMSRRTITAALKRDSLGGFSDYLVHLRCTAADRMLLDSKSKVNIISDMVGFSSVRSFIRDFTAYSDRTPLQQRKYYKELCKHKFNRIVHVPPHLAVDRICRHEGKLYASEWRGQVELLQSQQTGNS